MHFFRDRVGCIVGANLYNRRLRPGSDLRLKVLVYRAPSGAIGATPPTLWPMEDPMRQYVWSCRQMGYTPLYCITLRTIDASNTTKRRSL